MLAIMSASVVVIAEFMTVSTLFIRYLRVVFSYNNGVLTCCNLSTDNGQ
jgi:hypothetical protein